MVMWYTLTVLIAPALCCCLLRPAAAEAAPVTAAVPVDPVPAESAPACPHCRAEMPAPTAPQTPEPQPADQPCPCKDATAACEVGLPAADEAVVTSPDAPQSPVSPFAAAWGLSASVPVVFDWVPRTSPAGNLPFYSTDDLLRAFHLLRC